MCRSTLYLYLYCIYFLLLYLPSTCVNKMRVQFTISFYLKTMTATTFNTYQVWECLLGSPPSFDHNMTAPNFKSSMVWHAGQLLSCQNLFTGWHATCWKQAIKMLLASSCECLIEVEIDMEHAFTNKNTWNKTSLRSK